MSSLGAFAGGLGAGLQAGQDRKDRERDRELAARAMDVEEQRVRAGAYDPAPYRPMDRGAGRPSGGMGVRPTGQAQASNPEINIDEGDPRRGMMGTGASAATPAMGNNRLWDLVDRTEGGGDYDTLFGYSNNGGRFDDVRVSQMTLGELRDFASPSGEYGRWVRDELGRSGQPARIATPMGRWQIVGTTLRNAQRDLGLGDDVVFDANTQRQIADHLARNRLASSDTMEGKMRGLRNEWEGFRHVSDADLRAAILDFERTM